MVACCGCPQGAWELGSQREDQDLSVAWGLNEKEEEKKNKKKTKQNKKQKQKKKTKKKNKYKIKNNKNKNRKIKKTNKKQNKTKNMVACCGCPQGAWELGSQREDQDLSVAWGLDGLLWLSPWGLGIITSILVVVPRGSRNVLKSLFQ